MQKKRTALLTFCLNLAFLFSIASVMAQADRGAGLPAEVLPEELKGLEIKDHFVSTSLKKVGVIHALNGNMVVIHRATKEAYFGRPGDTIYEDDSLNTLADSRCRVKFFNEDVVTMAAETEFSVDSYQDQRKVGKKRSLFSMVKGKAMFYAMRLFRYKETRFRLKTPTVTVGIRGTKFGAHVYWVDKEKRVDATGIGVADKGDDIGMYLAAVNPGAGTSYTDCHSEDGFVEIEEENRVLGPGEMYRGETRDVIPTPPEVEKAFDEATEVKTEEEGEGEAEAEEEAEAEVIVADTGEKNILETVTDIAEEVSNITEQQTGTETETGEASIAQGKTAGEISGIATLIVDGAGQAYKVLGLKGPIYKYGPNKLKGGAETHVAYEIKHQNNDDYKITIQEQSYPSMDMKVTQFGWGAGTNAIASPHYFQWHWGGHYLDENGHEYLRWGYWEDTEAPLGQIGTGSDYYVATNKIWEIEGSRTHTDYISYLHQQGASYTYTGEAKGVIAHSAGAFAPHELSGPFSCHINFGNKQVSDLDINASGGVHSVHITGSGNLGSDGEFKLEGLTGTIDGNIVDSEATGAGGACFGGKAEGVAGDWQAHGGNDYWATGEFHGSR